MKIIFGFVTILSLASCATTSDTGQIRRPASIAAVEEATLIADAQNPVPPQKPHTVYRRLYTTEEGRAMCGARLFEMVFRDLGILNDEHATIMNKVARNNHEKHHVTVSVLGKNGITTNYTASGWVRFSDDYRVGPDVGCFFKTEDPRLGPMWTIHESTESGPVLVAEEGAIGSKAVQYADKFYQNRALQVKALDWLTVDYVSGICRSVRGDPLTQDECKDYSKWTEHPVDFALDTCTRYFGSKAKKAVQSKIDCFTFAASRIEDPGFKNIHRTCFQEGPTQLACLVDQFKKLRKN